MANDIFLRTTLTGTSLLFVLKTLSETKIRNFYLEARRRTSLSFSKGSTVG